MGERGATGGAWGARDDASWWSGGAGDMQNQQQINEEIARSTAAPSHQLFSYKMTAGFGNNTSETTNASGFDYRMMTNSNSARDESPQQPWWFGSGSVESQQTSSPTVYQNASGFDYRMMTNSNSARDESPQQPWWFGSGSVESQQTSSPTESPDSEQNSQQSNSNQNQLQQQNNQELLQQQNNQHQGLPQNQQQTLQQMLQQHQQQQQQQVLQQSLQQTLQVSQAQAQAIVQAQAVLQQQVAQTLQQQQQSLQASLQAVQQQQIHAALQRQSATLHELQQQQSQSLLSQGKGRMPRAKACNKPRGRITAYAYFVQTCREEHKKTHPEENVVFGIFSKKCAARWNTMSEEEKQRFHDMADQDKKRFDLEMRDYVPPKDVKVRGRKRNIVKDPNAPKRSLSAFFLFCNDERSKVKGENPEYTMGDIAKELGRRWAAAVPATKAKYDAKSELDKARYDREMTAYKKGEAVALTKPLTMADVGDDVVEYDGEDDYK